MHGFLSVTFVYLAAAVLFVPLAKRFGLGAVLGYLLAGLLIGPQGFGLAGTSAEQLGPVAEFGVVMLLFLVGMELDPRRLWKMRLPVFGLGAGQVVAVAAVLGGGAMLLGFEWRSALAMGLLLAMSSTALALAALQEKKLLPSPGGQASFSVLLFQDLAVIPILAILPLLATMPSSRVAHGAQAWPGWAQALAIVAAVAVIVFGGRFLLRPVFRFVAGSGLREAFTATALLLLVGVALLMESVGLSPALGAFLAGVVLAESEYRHELQADLEPFRGLFLGLFFITVGAGIDLRVIAERPVALALVVVGIMAGKAGVHWILGRLFGLGSRDAWLFSLSLSQVGEFAFVLLGLSLTLGVIPGPTGRLLGAAVALTMALTPFVLLAWEAALRKNAKAVVPEEGGAGETVPEEHHAPVVVAGFGRTGNIVGRLLRASGVPCVVLDVSPGLVESVRRNGLRAWYGDAKREELLLSAGVDKAKVLVVAVDDAEAAVSICELARTKWPGLRIVARSRGREDTYALLDLGVERVHRETFGTALEMGFDALVATGVAAHRARRTVASFRRYNEEALREMAKAWKKEGNEEGYRARLRQVLRAEEGMLSLDRAEAVDVDAGWDNATLRDEVLQRLEETRQKANPPPHA